MKISSRAQGIEPSLTRKLFNMALGMDGVIDLTLGDPDLIPPLNIREAGCASILSGKTRYSANAGLLDLRKQYALFAKEEFGVEANPLENIVVTVGGMEALFLALNTLVEKGDEIIVLGPYYVNYVQMIGMCDGTAVVVDVYGKPDEARIAILQHAISPKTKGIIVNNPCNPSGEILTDNFLQAVADFAIEHGLFIIADEVYSSLVFDGKKHTSLLSNTAIRDRAVLIDSCSKRFAMTGWRIGFAVGPKIIIENMIKMQENVAACAPLPSQYAAIEAYSERTDREYIVQTFEQRRNVIYEGLKNSKGLTCSKPEATFYMFVNIERTGLKSEEFAYKLLEQERVAVVPGKTYGASYDSYIRIAYTVDEALLKEAISRINRFLNSLEGVRR